ncbi:hypothetical protein P152DRAFT_512687 [Eremomyces bilateralis CBS 781.70]|uniref:Uncharacterized protein n=1 Tax=Eremomyces bilateralis CBS 781.70 TaxID=1392243 RepID=A0A6G1G8D3_9PEZI|nr:uncharacterized protein P152DRAFT_512687 [Eremomyces bilateralis CBS 781.70]KAF1814294.1 hypothetical protein P152DRAFT_512687 [Eremomyces bilateralis CBS 781.70]
MTSTLQYTLFPAPKFHPPYHVLQTGTHSREHSLTSSSTTRPPQLLCPSPDMPSTSTTTYLDTTLHTLPPSLPSPTFTNPDLILPDISHLSRSASTPSPPPSADLPPSPSHLVRQLKSQPSTLYNAPRSAAPAPPTTFNFSFGERRSHSALGVRTRTPSVARPGGRPLSDIEEVDVANPRGFAGLPVRTGVAFDPNSTSRDATNGADQGAIRNGFASGFWKAREERLRESEGATGHQRALSDASSSVHSDDLENMEWPGFDSMVEEEDDKNPAKEKPSKQVKPSGSDDEAEWSDPQMRGDEDDEDSSASLSRRADIILANAKKRLNLMEGNLRGARHSLLVTPARSSSPNQPLFNPSRHSTIGPLGNKSRQYSSPLATSTASQRHSRVYSETIVPPLPSPTHSPQNSRGNIVKETRSTSALAASSIDSFMDRNLAIRNARSHEVMRDSRLRNWVMSEDRQYHTSTPSSPPPALPQLQYSSKPSNSSLRHAQEPLPESKDAYSPQVQLTPSPGAPAAPTKASSNNTSHPRVSHTHTSSTTSTASSLQLQMQDLKGRISSLKRRAAEEKSKRYSLQAARTPSPINTAETWYQSAETYRSGTWGIGQDAGIGWSMSTAGFRPESAMSGTQGEMTGPPVGVVTPAAHSRQTSRSGVSFLEDSSIEVKSQVGSAQGSNVESAGGSAVKVGAAEERPKTVVEVGGRMFPLKSGSSRSTSRSSSKQPLIIAALAAPEVQLPSSEVQEEVVEETEQTAEKETQQSFLDGPEETRSDSTTISVEEEPPTLPVSEPEVEVEVDQEQDDLDEDTADEDSESEYESAYGDPLHSDPLNGEEDALALLDAEEAEHGGPVIAPRHEDRADAFDYENFFLHSAMGTYSRERRNSSDSWRSGSGSESDTGSDGTARAPSVRGDVEARETESDHSTEPPTPRAVPPQPARPITAIFTHVPGSSPTKPGLTPSSTLAAQDPFPLLPPQPNFLHERSPSGDSISTLATFMTATEGNESDDDDANNTLDAIARDTFGLGWSAPQAASAPAPHPTTTNAQGETTVQGGRGNAWAQRRHNSTSPPTIASPRRSPTQNLHHPLLPAFQSPGKPAAPHADHHMPTAAQSPRAIPLPPSPQHSPPAARTNLMDQIPVTFPLPEAPPISTEELVAVMLGPGGSWEGGEGEREALGMLVEGMRRAVGELGGLVREGKREGDYERKEWRRRVACAGEALGERRDEVL